MFHRRIMKNKINHLHEKCLCIVYSDKTSSFEKLLEIDRSVPTHIRNLQIFATEFFKESKYLAPTIFREFSSKRSVQYNLRHASEFSVPNVKSTFHGTESLSYLVPKIRDLVPKELKELSSLKSGSLKVALVGYVKNTFKILVSFDTFSDILDIFLLCFST